MLAPFLLAWSLIMIPASILASATDPAGIVTTTGSRMIPSGDQDEAKTIPGDPITLAAVLRNDIGEVSVKDREVLGAEGPELCVIVFVTTTCPIANASIPSMKRLETVVDEAGGRILLVHPDSLVTSKAASRHAAERDLGMEILLDPEQRLARRLQASVVPEAFVLHRRDGAWTTRYRGPVDDLYAGIGRRRRAATTFHAADAVRSIRAGDTIATPVRTAYGCAIERMRAR
jgi:hypothetical protein